MPQQSSSEPHPVDVYAGNRLREARLLIGLSQTALGLRLGVTFQQIQKYERGANRMSASKLWRAAQSLNVPVSYFFDQFRPDQPFGQEMRLQTDEIALLRHFRRMPQSLQRTLAEFAEALARDT
jgi:transcriptional regulator with XRE-family HTH domain